MFIVEGAPGTRRTGQLVPALSSTRRPSPTPVGSTVFSRGSARSQPGARPSHRRAVSLIKTARRASSYSRLLLALRVDTSRRCRQLLEAHSARCFSDRRHAGQALSDDERPRGSITRRIAPVWAGAPSMAPLRARQKRVEPNWLQARRSSPCQALGQLTCSFASRARPSTITFVSAALKGLSVTAITPCSRSQPARRSRRDIYLALNLHRRAARPEPRSSTSSRGRSIVRRRRADPAAWPP